VDVVFNSTTDISNFGKWNTFVPSAVILKKNQENEGLKVGTEMLFQVCMKGRGTATRSSNEIVTAYEELTDGRKGRRVAWKAARQLGLRAERVQEIVEIEAGQPGVPKSAKTEYTTWETFGGPLAFVLKVFMKDDLVNGFADWTKDLKEYCEGLETV